MTVAVTMGDPAGIGPEIIVTSWSELVDVAQPVIIGDAGVLGAAVETCNVEFEIVEIDSLAGVSPTKERLPVVDLDNVSDHDWGIVREDFGRASLEYIERAIQLAQSGAVDAIATAPINKRSIRLAGADNPGHTGLLADRTGTDEYAMMLIDGPLRVAHVSTHVPLREACEVVTTDRVYSTIKLLEAGIRHLGIDDPSIAVAGLNPHAGEEALLGREEVDEITPAIERAQDDNLNVSGPEPPDTVFSRAARGSFDGVVAMYHDQGHIPVKLLGFQDDAVSGVNVTLGLPIVRTSVDHGTAFDIAGECRASPDSLVQAVDVAARLAESRR